MPNSPTKACHASVGIIVNADRRILIAEVPSHKSKIKWGDWEFPGGGIEALETPEEALIRELEEEVGIRALGLSKLFSYFYVRQDRGFLLEMFLVTDFEGLGEGLEGQATQWVAPQNLLDFKLIDSNVHILEWLGKTQKYVEVI